VGAAPPSAEDTTIPPSTPTTGAGVGTTTITPDIYRTAVASSPAEAFVVGASDVPSIPTLSAAPSKPQSDVNTIEEARLTRLELMVEFEELQRRNAELEAKAAERVAERANATIAAEEVNAPDKTGPVPKSLTILENEFAAQQAANQARLEAEVEAFRKSRAAEIEAGIIGKLPAPPPPGEMGSSPAAPKSSEEAQVADALKSFAEDEERMAATAAGPPVAVSSAIAAGASTAATGAGTSGTLLEELRKRDEFLTNVRIDENGVKWSKAKNRGRGNHYVMTQEVLEENDTIADKDMLLLAEGILYHREELGAAVAGFDRSPKGHRWAAGIGFTEDILSRFREWAMLGPNKDRLDNTVQLPPAPDSDAKMFFNAERRDLGLEEGEVILNRPFPELFDLRGVRAGTDPPRLSFENVPFRCPVLLCFKARAYWFMQQGEYKAGHKWILQGLYRTGNPVIPPKVERTGGSLFVSPKKPRRE
jgi:hypothetical protein